MIKSILAAVLVVGFAGSALAQTPAPKAEAPKADPQKEKAKVAQAAIEQANVDVTKAREEIQKDRNAIVAGLMKLSDAEAAIFWPLYTEFRAAMKMYVGDRGTDLVVEYALNQDAITDEQARRLMTEWYAIGKVESDVKSAWFSKFCEKLPVKTATRFFQIDNKLDMIIRLQLAAELPLVK